MDPAARAFIVSRVATSDYELRSPSNQNFGVAKKGGARGDC